MRVYGSGNNSLPEKESEQVYGLFTPTDTTYLLLLTFSSSRFYLKWMKPRGHHIFFLLNNKIIVYL